MRANIRHATTTIRAKRAAVVAEVPDWEALRDAGAAIKDDALARLDEVLVELEASVTARGGIVHWARDAAEANEIVTDVVAGRGRARGREGEVARDRRDPAQRGARGSRASGRSRPTWPS